jgi:hypothetical protein
MRITMELRNGEIERLDGDLSDRHLFRSCQFEKR